MAARSFLNALVQGKCPRCRQGDMFSSTALDFSSFRVMNTTCPCCGVRLEPEPGFYQGAMYVSYAITITFMVVISIVLYMSGNPSEWVYIGTIIGVMLLLVPLNFRYSRILFLYFFGGIK